MTYHKFCLELSHHEKLPLSFVEVVPVHHAGNVRVDGLAVPASASVLLTLPSEKDQQLLLSSAPHRLNVV